MIPSLGNIGDISVLFVLERIISIFLSLYPIWLPVILIMVFWNLWLQYVRAEFVEKQGSLLLEIKLPLEITRSPAALELFYSALYQTGSATFLETYWDGKVRPWFSLEMVSIGGQVHFFIWTWPKFRNYIESHLYAHYPNIEITESPDYSIGMPHDPENITMWMTQYKLSDADAVPIKTYIDYGLDKDPKEEFKIDPLVPIIEFLGSIQHGEQIWIQILFQAHRKEGLVDGRIFKKDDWKKDAMKKIQEIKKEAADSEKKINPENTFVTLTKGQIEKINAIERSIDKWPFEVMIRSGYFATTEANKIGTRLAGIINAFRQVSANNYNGFKLGQFTDFDYPWQDFRRMRRTALEKDMLDAYKKRGFFQGKYKNFNGKPFILNTEELATIFHFPGEVSKTPTFQRVMFKKAEAPSNLPI